MDSIITGAFRLAFPEVWVPKAAVKGGKEKFSITMLFPKDGSSLIPNMPGNSVMEIRKLLFLAAQEKWGEDRNKWPSSLKKLDFKAYVSPNGKDGWPIRDGDTEEWDGFAEHLFMKAGSQFQPGIVDNKLNAIIDKQAVYGGLICRAQVNAFGYDSAGNQGVSIGLQNLQILKDDGTMFGGRQNPADVFDKFGDAGGGESAGDDDDFFK